MAKTTIDNGRSSNFDIETEVFADGGLGQVVSIVERKEFAVAVSGGQSSQNITSATVIPLDEPTAPADFARIRVMRTSGTSADDSRRYLFYTQDGVDPDDDGVPANGFLVHLDVFVCKLGAGNFSNFKMIAQTGETFTVLVEWLSRG